MKLKPQLHIHQLSSRYYENKKRHKGTRDIEFRMKIIIIKCLRKCVREDRKRVAA